MSVAMTVLVIVLVTVGMLGLGALELWLFWMLGQIAARLGRSPATVKAYFYDPRGEKAKAVNTPVARGLCYTSSE